ncbi:MULTISPECIES: hypothetical protein [Bacillus]|uniref:hypothetical protein n=1 Tax=Bacillus TaxID=1386 RepID=UPI0008FB36F5|nr:MULTISPECIES: hypothetical protein [Bacillus]ARW41720.1 hypothetical protein S100141_00397 [Bacillus licheniformis]MCA1182483.1 hypothetical protein [Bacillus licheniformis]MEC0474992.1 hypothetical protein [Bacillus licheniformis]MEC3606318.1 hypothetical protein [Bacillus glycinifermentans]OIS74606.1 hypothetical protein A4A40_18710 [Bacillus licheniformis]
MEQLLLNYAKEGVFLALFLYLLVWSIPKMRQEFKQDMKEMEERHGAEILRVEKKHEFEIEKVEEKAEKRENELMRLLTMFGDKYDILTHKVDEVLKKLEK